MIVLIAPYSPSGREDKANLGAARKIEAVLEILHARNEKIVLVNTAHNSTKSASLSVAEVEINGVGIFEITLSTISSRRIGKFLNIFEVEAVNRIIKKLGVPSLVWLYNGYAFEARFGRRAKKVFGCPIILEMEDWHFSRDRGLNPKPYLDWIYWRLLIPSVSYAFAVNMTLAKRIQMLGVPVGLFPGVVANGIENIAAKFPVFTEANLCTVVGYFGGLSSEKGADLVAALVPLLPSTVRLVVTGSGSLEESFLQATASYKERIAFYGRVDDATLLSLIASCDVLLNPHAPIAAMANGVFPFKVVEGIASGRLMISTALPSDGLDSVLQGVKFIDHDVHSLLDAIVSARTIYRRNEQSIKRGAYEAARLFGKEAILSKVNQVCDGVSQ